MRSGVAEFGWEAVESLLKDAGLRDLLGGYYEELSPYKAVAPLAVNFDLMAEWEKIGGYRVWVARVNGALAGMIGFQLCPHLNYKTTLFAIDSGHYLSPAYRGKEWIGVKMWGAACEALKELGVKIVIAHDNVVHPLDPFFKRLGFEPRSTLFWKAL